jgi:isopenicillin-N N-acyltransferase like protein
MMEETYLGDQDRHPAMGAMDYLSVWSRFRRLLRPRVAAEPACAPFRYPEGRHGKGELVYIQGLPVLRLQGTPEDIGAQTAILGLKPAAGRLLRYPRELLQFFFYSRLVSQLLLRRLTRIGRGMVARFPEAYRGELESLIEVGGFARNPLVAANTMLDMKNMGVSRLFGCSSLVVDAARSATGGPIFGRNMDFFGLGYLQHYGLVLVYPRGPERRHAFVSVGFPGMIGCSSGMNDAGLAAASHEIFDPAARRKFNPNGLPFALAYRHILEQCATVEEACSLLQSIEPTTSTSLVVCDRRGGAVFEVCPDRVVQRGCIDGLAVCSNHYCTVELSNPRQRNTYGTLERLVTLREGMPPEGRFGIAEVHARLHAVHQGELTLHTMIFEPESLRLHLALGPKLPATANELTTLDLAPLWGR